jgi:hypothetical protein
MRNGVVPHMQTDQASVLSGDRLLLSYQLQEWGDSRKGTWEQTRHPKWVVVGIDTIVRHEDLYGSGFESYEE